MPFVYIVQCSDGSFYTGSAKDVARRLAQHNAGRGGRYTAGRRPVTLVWQQEVATWREALQLERAIKRLKREEKWAITQCATASCV